jgi:recombination protein RecT
MANEIQKSNIQKIKEYINGAGAVAIFKDNLPSAIGDQAEKMARRFAKQVYTAILQNPTLQNCTPQSLLKSASIAASLDLDIDPRGLAYLVPYKNKGVMEAQFQIGYMGLMELAYRSGKVKSIIAHVIREVEKGQVTISRVNGQYQITHPWTYEQPAGDVVAAYAVAEVEGLGPQTCLLRRAEIDKFRAVSKAPDSPAWKDHFEAMCKKTAIRQLAKFLPKSIIEDMSHAISADERETFDDASTAAQTKIEAEAGSEVVDAAFEEPQQAAQGEEMPEWMKGE